jgi:quercetin dioxygenase-like cupin family protein
MRIWQAGDAAGKEPPGHYGGLRVADVVARGESGEWSVQLSICPPGGGGEKHAHEHDAQLFYVLTGELTFDVGARRFTLRPGEAVLFEPREAHATHNHGAEESRSLVVTVDRRG